MNNLNRPIKFDPNKYLEERKIDYSSISKKFAQILQDYTDKLTDEQLFQVEKYDGLTEKLLQYLEELFKEYSTIKDKVAMLSIMATTHVLILKEGGFPEKFSWIMVGNIAEYFRKQFLTKEEFHEVIFNEN